MTSASPVTLETERLVLTLPPPSAAGAVAAHFRANARNFRPWDPPRPKGFLTEAFWTGMLEHNRNELRHDRALRLFLARRDDRVIIGHANFNNFVRGAFQSCTLGYAIDRDHEGRGLMAEALRAAIPHVFDELGFHRIEANHRPDNDRSAGLLRALGFAREGYARNYLYIDGAWRDHVLNALENPSPRPPVVVASWSPPAPTEAAPPGDSTD